VFRFLPGRFTATNTPVSALIAYAYQVRDFQISGGPDWLRSQRFDIGAKEPEALDEELEKLPAEERYEKYRWLVQSMLADRFNLKLRQETKELPTYALVVAKSGPKLEPAKPGVGIESHTRHFLVGKDHLMADGADMPYLARILSEPVGRTILDQTGLKGNYKLELHWTPDLSPSGVLRGPADATSAADTTTASDSSGPSIFTAIQEQLGLKLESTKGPVEVIVIDHIERPSEN
jgi:uncharacterized protein (TIGR03435 family)